jgi:hypothetical protein
MIPYTPLRMMAQDGEDLDVIAACLQDALVPLAGLEFDQQGGHFRLVANRFCWECDSDNQAEGISCHTRVTAGIAFHHVREVQKKGLSLHKGPELINLLTIHTVGEDGCIHLVFSGGAEIKLKVDKLDCHLKDMDEPYPTPLKPQHGG